MNVKQKRCLWVGVFFFVLAGLVPPWIGRVDIPYRAHFERPLGYSFIINPPNPGGLEKEVSIQLDLRRLSVEWLIVAMVTGAGIATMSGRNS